MVDALSREMCRKDGSVRDWGFKYFRMLFSIHREVVKDATIHETLSDS